MASGYPIDRIYRKQGGQEMVFPAETILNMQGGAIIGMMPTTDYFVDGANGSDDNTGRSWSLAFDTIQAAMDAITALGAQRGRSRVFVAPGGYAENVITPTNAIAPFGQLIGVNPTGRSFGGAYIYGATGVSLTIRARGWLVEGFEIGAIANFGAILLHGDAGGNKANGTEIRNCIISGWGATATYGINVIYNGAPLTVVRNCHFNGCVGPAIKCTESGFDQPRFWEIDRCTFVDNGQHIGMNPRGFKESWIHHCAFIEVGANRTATEQLDNRGGSNCIIGPGNFLSSTYDWAGGYRAGSNEYWRGNHHEDSGGPGDAATGESNPAE